MLDFLPVEIKSLIGTALFAFILIAGIKATNKSGKDKGSKKDKE